MSVEDKRRVEGEPGGPSSPSNVAVPTLYGLCAVVAADVAMVVAAVLASRASSTPQLFDALVSAPPILFSSAALILRRSWRRRLAGLAALWLLPVAIAGIITIGPALMIVVGLYALAASGLGWTAENEGARRDRKAILVGWSALVAGLLVIGTSGFVSAVEKHSRRPTPEELPSASEVPMPDGFRISDGTCPGGVGGCYVGEQVFILQQSNGPSASCAKVDSYFATIGWHEEPLADLAGKRGWIRPDRTLAVSCIDGVPGASASLLALWPGKVRFVSFDEG